jgi:hypothetical protein
MAAWALGRRAPLLPIFLSPSRRRCRQRERGISVESCFFSPLGSGGAFLSAGLQRATGTALLSVDEMCDWAVRFQP